MCPCPGLGVSLWTLNIFTDGSVHKHTWRAYYKLSPAVETRDLARVKQDRRGPWLQGDHIVTCLK